ncbi:hypothetical protein [Hymenobacter sp.]|uniref:hypothetical protein n=1 Tax=Hymenobacter sp. TaxID=1898978 RepID=UPI00286CC1E3|nr:hypothetical protein [Hymenobacter sp.]
MNRSTLFRGALAPALALGLLLATSCEKPPPEPAAVPLPAELKAYVLFQPGTHWIYQDSASQQLDSVWVVSTEMTEFRLVEKRKSYLLSKHEDFRLRTRSSRGGPDQVYRVRQYCGFPGRGDGDDTYPCWAITRGQSLPASTADEGDTQVFPYTIPRDRARTDYLFGVMQPYWHSRPLAIGNTVYPDVMEVNIPIADASEGGWPAQYYWAPGLGIVRQRVRVNFLPHTRTLLRSRIVQ